MTRSSSGRASPASAARCASREPGTSRAARGAGRGRRPPADRHGRRLPARPRIPGAEPGFPAVRRWVDLAALRMQPVPGRRRVARGAVARERIRCGIPPVCRRRCGAARHPAGCRHPRRWILPVAAAPRSVIAGPDSALDDGWDRVGLRGPLRTRGAGAVPRGGARRGRGATSDASPGCSPGCSRWARRACPHGASAPARTAAPRLAAAGAEIRPGMRVTRLRRRDGVTEVDVAGASRVGARSVVVAVGPGAVTTWSRYPGRRRGDCRPGGSPRTAPSASALSPSTVAVAGRWSTRS